MTATTRRHLYRFGPFELDVLRRGLFRDRQLVPLTPKRSIFCFCSSKSGANCWIRTRFCKTLWPETVVEEANLTQQIFTIRKVLGEQRNGRPYVETVVRRGYVFVAPVEEIHEGEETPAADRVRGRVLILITATPNSPSRPLPTRWE